jgi:hypothetical protein
MFTLHCSQHLLAAADDQALSQETFCCHSTGGGCRRGPFVRFIAVQQFTVFTSLQRVCLRSTSMLCWQLRKVACPAVPRMTFSRAVLYSHTPCRAVPCAVRIHTNNSSRTRNKMNKLQFGTHLCSKEFSRSFTLH